jgi:DNA primase
VRVLELGGNLDPDEYVKASGADAYRQRLEKAPVYFHWLADRARKKFDMRTVEGRMDAFKFLAPKIQSIADRLERFAVANDVANYLGVDEKLVRDHFSKGTAEHPPAPKRPEMPATERLLLHSLLASEAARAQVIPELGALGVIERFVSRNVFQALFAMHSDGAPFRFSDLEGRLSDVDQDLLSSAVFADDRLDERMALRVALDCLEKFKGRESESEVARLRAQAKAAEKAGDIQEAMRLNVLMTQMDQLRRQSRKAVGGVVH